MDKDKIANYAVVIFGIVIEGTVIYCIITKQINLTLAFVVSLVAGILAYNSWDYLRHLE